MRIITVMLLGCLSLAAIPLVAVGNSERENKKNLREIERYVDDYYRGLTVVAVFSNDDGLVFDCFPREYQPNLRRVDPQTGRVSFDKLAIPPEEIVENDTGVGCPAGSVPYPHVDAQEIASYGTLTSYLSREFAPLDAPPGSDGVGIASLVGHLEATSNAVAHAVYTGPISGGGADAVSLWHLTTQGSVYASTVGVMVSGDGGGGPYQSVSAGYHVYPDFTGVSHSVFYVYANDGFSQTCYNYGCGYVQVSGQMQPYWSPGSMSTVGGPTFAMNLYIKYDANTPASWRIYWNNIVIGYYPAATTFTSGPLGAGGANRLVTGGWVNPRKLPMLSTIQYTTTDMGNGLMPSNSTAAFIQGIKVFPGILGPWTILGSASLSTSITTPNCWSTTVTGASYAVQRFGGPGRNTAGGCNF